MARIEARRGLDFVIEPLDLSILIAEVIEVFDPQEDGRVHVRNLLDEPRRRCLRYAGKFPRQFQMSYLMHSNTHHLAGRFL